MLLFATASFIRWLPRFCTHFDHFGVWFNELPGSGSYSHTAGVLSTSPKLTPAPERCTTDGYGTVTSKATRIEWDLDMSTRNAHNSYGAEPQTKTLTQRS